MIINRFTLYLPFLIIGLLSGCVSIRDSSNPVASPLHSKKDLAITFPAWFTESQKLDALNSAAIDKAKQKCNESSFKTVEILSEPFIFGPPARNSVISANIFCDTTQQLIAIQKIPHPTSISAVTSLSKLDLELENLKKQVEDSNLKQLKLQAQIEKQRDQALAPLQDSKPNKTPSAQTTKSVTALVIDNSSYSKSALVNPVNDANEVAKRLNQFGFSVKLILDGDRRALIKALNDFQSQSSKYDVNILFFAGHGIQYNGVNYLIPIDMSLDAGAASIEFEGISTNQIVDKYMRGKTRLVFLDACRDNPLSRSLHVSSRGGGNTRGLATMDVSSGTLISYSTKDGNVALDGNGKNSPYTESLLKYLDNREDISLILRKVRQNVMDKTGGKQVPWDYGSLVGDHLVLSNK